MNPQRLVVCFCDLSPYGKDKNFYIKVDTERKYNIMVNQ